MQATIVDRHLSLTPEDNSAIERRLSFALSRFSGELAAIQVVIDDQNGPRGGVDKLIRINVRLQSGAPLTVIERAPSAVAGTSQAAARMARRVAQRVSRRRARPVAMN